MEELLMLNDEVEESYLKIPQEYFEKDIDSPLIDEYNINLDKFIIKGRMILNDNNLSYDDIKEKVYEHAIKEVQEILESGIKKAHDNLVSSSRTVQKTMEKLEYILAEGSADKESAEFLNHFSNAQIASLKALQEYIRSIF